jgi:hypothetical protein
LKEQGEEIDDKTAAFILDNEIARRQASGEAREARRMKALLWTGQTVGAIMLLLAWLGSP